MCRAAMRSLVTPISISCHVRKLVEKYFSPERRRAGVRLGESVIKLPDCLRLVEGVGFGPSAKVKAQPRVMEGHTGWHRDLLFKRETNYSMDPGAQR